MLPLLALLLLAGPGPLRWPTSLPDRSGPGAPLVSLGLERIPLPFPIHLRPRHGAVYGTPALSFRAAQELPDAASQERPGLLQSEFADLEVHLKGRGEFGGDWTRFQPCEVGLQKTCDPGLFPQLKPDIQLGARITGTVADRIHVDVDYDETREFSAANNVNIRYQGEPGEVVQSVEVGDVTLTFPQSRFLTRGIPAGNFGFRALTRLGPIELQTVWAQQNGDVSSREFQLSGVGDRQAFVQEDTLVLDDADYVEGQFFFLVDPRLIEGYPHVDILALDPGAAPPAAAPGPGPIQLYRLENDPVTRQQVEGYIQAEAVAEGESGTVSESGWFRYLQPGVDYLLHPSGLWVALRRPLRRDEALAVTYLTATGDSVGDYNPEQVHNEGRRPTLRLLKASGPRHQPGEPTWDLEMHQIYRISGSDDVEPSSVALSISLGELSAGRTFKRRSTGEEITLLRLFGLDEEAPTDEVDPSQIYRPAQDFLDERSPVSGTFIVFPTLRPFAEPPPLPSANLSAAETKAILGADANPKIYESVDPVERENGGLFRLTIPFRIRSEGVISTFSLGALGIRDGSERIYFGERLLRPGEDYLIDYDVGQVTLLSPQALFASDPQARIRATWEQKALFRVAPTSIFGLNARYGVGEVGAVHLLGLYQQERTLQTRPQIGMEPASLLQAGLNADLTFGAGWLDRFQAKLPGLGADSASSLRMRGEMALTLPNPNTRGDVYLDDFDATDELPLSLFARDWKLGSAPADPEGTGAVLPPTLDAASASALVWQHTWILEGASGDSLGIFEGLFPRRDIDRQIRIAGTETRQTVLRLTFSGPGGGGVGGEPAWRSLTTLLSPTGADLSRTDYLEFYAAGGEGLTLILDLGRVSEDVFFVDAEGRTGGVNPRTGEEWGLGLLDQEADPRRGEIWNDRLDAEGVWAEECEGERGRIYPLGDPRANCTRRNGRNDTEDLDGDGNLSTTERVYRYVVRLDGSSPYLARTRQETGTAFQLYRIPLRGPDAVNVGGRVNEADWRAVKHLRITVAGGAGASVTLARMSLIGSRWVKRGREGVLAGLAGTREGSGGQVEVEPVSALSEGADYQSPPGVLEELDDPSRAYGGGGVEFAEKSLAVRVRGLAPGERAEVYSRFPQRPRNFLNYRAARLWMLGREGDWGEQGVEFILKVGTDAENFYLVRTRRPPPPAAGAVTPSDWLPELVVDFDRWLSLRRRAEEELIFHPPSEGAPPIEVWSADSTYAVFLTDRARAPNLAAVREIALTIWNGGDVPLDGTVWVDELRLSRAARDAGYAGYLDVDLEAPGLLHAAVSYRGRGPFFRQLSEDPTYQGEEALSLRSTLEMGRIAPESWGLSLPLTVSYARQDQDPTFLPQSDVRADRLSSLRRPSFAETRIEVGLHKLTPVGVPLLDPLLGGLNLRAGYTRSSLSTPTLESEGTGVDARLEFSPKMESRTVPLVPRGAEGLIRALLPSGLEETVLGARLRWTPETLRVATRYDRRRREAFRFEQVLRLPEDSLAVPTRSPIRALETSASVGFRPFSSLSLGATFFSTRDLLPPREATPETSVQPLLLEERWRPGPFDLGWETRRILQTRFGFQPSVASWLRTDLAVATDYAMNRNPTFVERRVTGTDTLLLLQRSANGSRSTRLGLSLELGGLARALGAGVGEPEGEDKAGRLLGLLDAVHPLVVNRQSGLSSRFFRRPVDPGGAFQMGWGGREDFRFLEGDTAFIFTGRTSWTARGGVGLPLGLDFTSSYTDTRVDVLHQRSDRQLRTRAWPDFRLEARTIPLPFSWTRWLERVSLASGFRRNRVETAFGGRGIQRRVRTEKEYPFDFGASWAGGVITRYRGEVALSEGGDPTGRTRGRRETHAFELTSVLAEPPWLGSRLDGPLRISLAYRYASETNCRALVGGSGCVAFVDLLNRSLNLTLDTVLLPLEVGLHLTYSSRRSFVGRHDGTTQLQLGVFGQFLFESGGFASPSGGGSGVR